MVAFPKPSTSYDYDVDEELAALRGYSSLPDRGDRAIPAKTDGQLLLATWNLANLGVQKRRDKDYRLIAEIISWFDLIAVQEVNDNLVGLRAIESHLPETYTVLFNDAGGNRERFAFIYDHTKVKVLEEVGEVTVPAIDLPKISVPSVHSRFVGFDRNPMLASFEVGKLRFALANVHLYFGTGRPPGKPDDETPGAPAAAPKPKTKVVGELPPAAGINRRILEAAAIAYWANQRHKDKYAYTPDAVALGDFNLPINKAGDAIYDALTAKGLQLPPHSTHVIGSNLGDDAHYDQMAFLPGAMLAAVQQVGIFDFDGAVFRGLWGTGTDDKVELFRAYLKYYLSDHRPLWMALNA